MTAVTGGDMTHLVAMNRRVLSEPSAGPYSEVALLHLCSARPAPLHPSGQESSKGPYKRHAVHKPKDPEHSFMLEKCVCVCFCGEIPNVPV